MTFQHQHPDSGTEHRPNERDATSTAGLIAARPAWLMPGLAVGVVAVALVVLGVLSASTVLYAGLIGGMVLMHLGGHGGHSRNGGHGGHRARASASASGVANLREPSSDTQDHGAASAPELDDRALRSGSRNERQDDDQHNDHGCH